MIAASQICQMARYNVGDAGHTTYSDYEVMAALQSSLDLLITSCDECFSPLLVKSAELELPAGRAALPEDFRSVVSALGPRGAALESNYETGPFRGEFRFENSEIVSPEPRVALTYRYRPARLTAIDDEIDAPEVLLLPLARMTALLLKGDFETAQAVSDRTAQAGKTQRWENAGEPRLWGGYVPQ